MSAAESEAITVRERTRRLTAVPAVWWAIAAITLDRAITLPFWAYEANPLVAGLGQLQWLGLTAVLINGLLIAWYPLRARSVRLMHWLMGLLAVIHLAIAVSNVAVVTGVA